MAGVAHLFTAGLSAAALLFMPCFGAGREEGSTAVAVDSADVDTAVADRDSSAAKPRLCDRYYGITPLQDSLARRIVRLTHAFKDDEAEKGVETLRELEQRDSLPPLSFLLAVSRRVLMVRNGHTRGPAHQRRLRREVDLLRRRYERVLPQQTGADSLTATYLFIDGGLRGYAAALKLDNHPLEALGEGLKAMRSLKRALALDSTVADAWLGLGIFHCTASRAPRMVRGALALFGLAGDREAGLDYLRITAERGRYARTVSALYLVRFLSPYYGHLTVEKREVLQGLQQRFPANPYYLFLELDELLCFHPERFYAIRLRDKVEKAVESFDTTSFQAKRYCVLTKWQYWLMNSFPGPALRLRDRDRDVLGSFAWYPVFLRAVKHHHASTGLMSDSAAGDTSGAAVVRDLEEKALKLLEGSGLSATLRRYYAWHITDALQPRGAGSGEDGVGGSRPDTSRQAD